jgi:phosphopantetheine adenylyltransferase/dephospho-CoA kinase
MHFRSEKNFQELDIHLIKLVDDTCHELVSLEESKVSSSNRRVRLLGEQLRLPEGLMAYTEGPYVIGLTGGSASGKSNIARYLEDLGAGVIDCDKLGHK